MMELLDEVIKAEFDALCKKNYNDAQVFKRLIENKNFFNRQFANGDTPLLAALHHEHINPYLIQDLLKNSDIQRKDKDGKAPLEIALERKEYFVAYLLIKKGAMLNVSFDKFRSLFEIFAKNEFSDKDNHIRDEIRIYFDTVKKEKFSSIEFQGVSDDLSAGKEDSDAQDSLVHPKSLIQDTGQAVEQVMREHTQSLAKETSQSDIKDLVEPAQSTPDETTEVFQEIDVVDQAVLSPISQVLKAMVNREVVPVDDKDYRKALYEQMNWTALRTKKISVDDLQGITSVLNDIQKDIDSEHSFKLHQCSPNVQSAIFNIVAYAAKLSAEKPSKMSKLNKVKEDKYNTTIDFLKSILNDGSPGLEEKVKVYMKRPEITASRGTKLYKLHGLFSGKGFDVQSTMQELFHDLNKVLEEENSQDSTLEL